MKMDILLHLIKQSRVYLLIASLAFLSSSVTGQERADKLLVKRADLVTTAEVIEVYSSPGFWSGFLPALQKVKYKIVKTLKGKTDRTEIIVAHYVVKNSKTADLNDPELSPVLFSKGNTLMLFLKKNPQGSDQTIGYQYVAWSENYGAIITSRKIEKAIRKIIDGQKSAMPASYSRNRKLSNSFLPPYQQDDYEQGLYKLKGSITGYETEESAKLIFVKLYIDYVLRNVSDRNIILWKRNEPDFEIEPTFTGKVVATEPDFDYSKIIENHYGGPSNDTSEKFATLREYLDQPAPPAGETLILKPDETWTFSSHVSLITNKVKKSEPSRELTFADLPGTPLWLKVHYETWSFNIEPPTDDVDADLPFGKTLQKKWKKYGHLMLRDITSEPIEVNLRLIPETGKPDASNAKLSSRSSHQGACGFDSRSRHHVGSIVKASRKMPFISVVLLETTSGRRC